MTLITSYAALTAPALADELVIVDASDTSMSSAGTTKHVTAQLLVNLGKLAPTAVQTANYTASPGDLALLNTTSGALASNKLPNAPADQTMVGWKLVISTTPVNSATILTQGSDVINVASGSTSATLLRLNQLVIFQYKASTGIWYIIGTDPALSIDTTATDIQPNGIQAAGATGKVPDAGHIHPATGLPAPADTGVIAWTADPFTSSSAAAGAMTSGKLMLVAFWVRKTATISNIGVNVSTAGSTLTTGENLAGIYNSSGTLMGQTADQTTAWGSAGTVAMAITSPFSAAGGMYWVAFLGNGGTGANLRGTNSNLGLTQLGQSAATSRVGVYGSGLTALPGTITPSSIVQANANLYCVVIY